MTRLVACRCACAFCASTQEPLAFRFDGPALLVGAHLVGHVLVNQDDLAHLAGGVLQRIDGGPHPAPRIRLRALPGKVLSGW